MKKRLVLGIFLAVGLVGLTGLLLWQAFPLSAPVQAQAAEDSEGPVMVLAVEKVVNGERFGGEVRVTFTYPDELPDSRPAASGLMASRTGDTLTLGTGAIEVDVSVEVINDEEPTTVIEADYDGDEIQVQVTSDTIIYRDTTERPEIGQAEIEAGRLTMERTIEPGELADIGENMLIRVWGSEQGGEILADVLVYEPIH